MRPVTTLGEYREMLAMARDAASELFDEFGSSPPLNRISEAAGKLEDHVGARVILFGMIAAFVSERSGEAK